jgi:hypothetical protein
MLERNCRDAFFEDWQTTNGGGLPKLVLHLTTPEMTCNSGSWLKASVNN